MKFKSLKALPLMALTMPLSAMASAENVLGYSSVFETYQAYSEPELQNWPKVNDTVGDIGGWRVYAREPYETGATEQSPPADGGKGHAQDAPHHHAGGKP
ncbi:hypothetical protein [Limnobacter sp.]|uniref:hypothetical protein n=1 Tax=Limnobacter sp. TaxID=2003368 RepID=UPI003510ECE6